VEFTPDTTAERERIREDSEVGEDASALKVVKRHPDEEEINNPLWPGLGRPFRWTCPKKNLREVFRFNSPDSGGWIRPVLEVLYRLTDSWQLNNYNGTGCLL